MTTQLDLKILKTAVAHRGIAFRCSVELQPAAGEGTKVFPPTYSGAVYAMEKRRLPGYTDPVECVLLDSVQSQANRMEEALQQAVDDGRIKIPVIEVDFTDYFPGDAEKEEMRLQDPVDKVSSLQAPHRIADAILRDSTYDGKRFRDSDIGKRIGMVSLRDATALFEFCPTALVFGMWDSTGPKGGLGAKFERALVGEIVGIGAVYGVRTSSRIDPLGIQKDAGPLYRRADGLFTVDADDALEEIKDEKRTGKKLLYKPNSKGLDVYHDPAEKKFADQGKPSVANHGNVTPDLKDKDQRPYPGGVTISHAEQTIVLSLPALRRLRFPLDGKYDKNRDDAARTVLAALGLCSAAMAVEAGLDLRSRCLLWPKDNLKWELLKPGAPVEEFVLPADQAVNLLNEAVQEAKSLKLPWQDEPVVLKPSPDLVKLVVKSQQLAVKQGGEAGDGGDK
jgi:CRISPR-associated protein Csb1